MENGCQLGKEACQKERWLGGRDKECTLHDSIYIQFTNRQKLN